MKTGSKLLSVLVGSIMAASSHAAVIIIDDFSDAGTGADALHTMPGGNPFFPDTFFPGLGGAAGIGSLDQTNVTVGAAGGGAGASREIRWNFQNPNANNSFGFDSGRLNLNSGNSATNVLGITYDDNGTLSQDISTYDEFFLDMDYDALGRVPVFAQTDIGDDSTDIAGNRAGGGVQDFIITIIDGDGDIGTITVNPASAGAGSDTFVFSLADLTNAGAVDLGDITSIDLYVEGDGGGDLDLDLFGLRNTAVSEPGLLGLLGVGLASVMYRRRKMSQEA